MIWLIRLAHMDTIFEIQEGQHWFFLSFILAGVLLALNLKLIKKHSSQLSHTFITHNFTPTYILTHNFIHHIHTLAYHQYLAKVETFAEFPVIHFFYAPRVIDQLN